MTDWNKILKSASIRSFRVMLSELANLRQKEEADKLPIVSVCLHSGQTFVGKVVKVEQGHMYDMLMLHQEQQIDRWNIKNHIIYLNMNEIVGVVFEDADQSDVFINIISGGKITRRSALEPVSKLNFQRFLRDKSVNFATEIHENFAIEISQELLESNTDFADYQYYAEKITSVLEDLLQDKMGKEALQSNVKKLKIASASAFSVKLEAGTLILFFDANEVNKQLISFQALKDAIEKTL